MIRAALGRLLKLFVATTAGSGVLALLVGLPLGASADRSVSVAWDAVGAFLVLGGFFVGNRGPARATGTQGWGPLSFRSRAVRWASRSEQEEAINLSAVLVLIGFGLIMLGIAVDRRYSLV